MEDMEMQKKRRQRKYWREIKGSLYARLQYQDEAGKWREKLKPISDKRTALRVVEEMRRELLSHGEEMLNSDKILFSELVTHYSSTKLTEATYANGIKISGRRSLEPVHFCTQALT